MTAGARSARDLIETYWRAANARDWDGFAALVHQRVVYEVPQTRERVRGREDYVEFNRTWPGDWRAELVELIGEGTKGMSVIDFIVDGETMTGISVFETDGQVITRITDWWPSPYEPPPRMTSRIERY